MTKKMLLALVLVALGTLGIGCSSSSDKGDTAIATATEGSCAALVGHVCSQSEELMFLKVRISDGQAKVPDTVAQQLREHKELLEAMAKTQLEERKLQLQRQAEAAKSAEPCAQYAQNDRAFGVCRSLQ